MGSPKSRNNKIKVSINKKFQRSVESMVITSLLFIFTGFIMMRVITLQLLIDLFGEGLGEMLFIIFLIVPITALVMFLFEVLDLTGFLLFKKR